jgi:hypothetical protein
MLARNHSARLKVAYWDLPNFEQKRMEKHNWKPQQSLPSPRVAKS